jgi:hypothetical protein
MAIDLGVEVAITLSGHFLAALHHHSAFYVSPLLIAPSPSVVPKMLTK